MQGHDTTCDALAVSKGYTNFTHKCDNNGSTAQWNHGCPGEPCKEGNPDLSVANTTLRIVRAILAQYVDNRNLGPGLLNPGAIGLLNPGAILHMRLPKLCG